jgi:hypothetical protein
VSAVAKAVYLFTMEMKNICLKCLVDQYMDDFSKMALALTSAQMAKDAAVEEHGVGEDLAIHFLAWIDDGLIAITQMNSETMKLDPEVRFDRCKEACKVLRREMWATAITMVSEGYCSLDSHKTKNMDLALAFSDPKLPIYECLTVSHASIDEENGHITPTSMVAAPYRLALGRKVEWKEVLVYPEKAEHHTKQAKYPHMLNRVLQMSPSDSVDDEGLIDAAAKIASFGFIMQSII